MFNEEAYVGRREGHFINGQVVRDLDQRFWMPWFAGPGAHMVLQFGKIAVLSGNGKSKVILFKRGLTTRFGLLKTLDTHKGKK